MRELRPGADSAEKKINLLQHNRGRGDGVVAITRASTRRVTHAFRVASPATQAGYNYDETVSTLRYANRAKNIKNKPKINEDPKDAMLREFQDEIARLKAQLQGKGTYDENGEWQGAASASRRVHAIDATRLRDFGWFRTASHRCGSASSRRWRGAPPRSRATASP